MTRSELFIGLACILHGDVVTVMAFEGTSVLVEGPHNGEELVSPSKLKPIAEGRSWDFETGYGY